MAQSSNSEANCFYLLIRAEHPLVLDKLESEDNINIYLKELIFTDLYAHDGLVSAPDASNAVPVHDSYADRRVSLRMNPEEDDDILTYLRSKSSRGSNKVGVNAYVTSLIYHDLGLHDKAAEVYCPVKEEKVKNVKPERVKKEKKPKEKKPKGKKTDRTLHFRVEIPPEYPLALAKLETVDFDPEYVKDLILKYGSVDGRSKLLRCGIDGDIPPEPESYYRKENGCVIDLSYEPENEGDSPFVKDQWYIKALTELEIRRLLQRFVVSLIYHDVGWHNIAAGIEGGVYDAVDNFIFQVFHVVDNAESNS